MAAYYWWAGRARLTPQPPTVRLAPRCAGARPAQAFLVLEFSAASPLPWHLLPNFTSIMVLLDGKATAALLRQQLQQQVSLLLTQGHRVPHLVAVLVGENAASQSYVSGKLKACEEVGYRSTLHKFSANLPEAELLALLTALNEDDAVDGILVQLPLPKQIAEEKVIEAVHPSKDVDGFHPVNVGRMAKGLPALVPATPGGIIALLRHYAIATEGKHCVVVGRSNIVGTPMALLMSRASWPGNATVTICHSKTVNLSSYTLQADIVIAAAGQPQLITAAMVKAGAVVVDVGIHRVPAADTKTGFRLLGDVRFAEVATKAAALTPVPGGVGPMTIAQLLVNTLQAYRSRKGL